MIRVDQFHIVRQIDIRSENSAFAVFFQRQRDFIAVVQLEHDALQVQQDVDDVFLHAVERRVLVQHAGDRDFGRRIADHRRQQHAAQRVAQRVAVAALKRLHHDFGMTGAERFDFNNTGFQQTVLHGMSFSIPSARYTDKADGNRGQYAKLCPRDQNGQKSKLTRIQFDDQRFVDVVGDFVTVRQ